MRTADDYLPEKQTLQAMKAAAKGCKGCDLYKGATQTVFGAGPRKASLLFVGEQPGDQEDKQGEVFVGPAGKLLDRALEEAGLDRKQLYLTNAVKHFKWKPMGKRRLHQKPNASELGACRPWLAKEVELVKPEVLVCLGATAAQAVVGKAVRMKDVRGKFLATEFADKTYFTVHPSFLLRIPEREERHREYAAFVKELKKLKKFT